jgi:TolB-like protein
LLGLLAARHPEVVSKDAIMKAVWPGRVVEEANLNVQISRLRQILDQNRERGSCIQTIPGRGYCFVAPVIRLRAEPQPASPTFTELAAHPQQRLSIVVLPFDNLSRDPGQQYLADGITEDLTTNLSRFTDLLVISSNTAFTYRDKPLNTPQIGRELGVRYVLKGSVRQSAERVRVNAQLIEAEADAHLWAERFDCRLSDLFALQDEVASAIAGAIEPELLKSERNRVGRRPLQTENAYEFYQRGLWHFYRYTREDSVEAQALFRRALALDGEYTQPTAQLAITLCNAAYLGWVDNVTRNYVEAYELAQRAVSLDARYPPAHFALGLVCMWTHRSDAAMSSLQEAIDLNPSYAAAHVLFGQMHLYHGHPEEAIVLAEKGIRLSPKDPRLFIWLAALAGAQYQLRHYAQAVETGRRSWMLNRNWPAGLRYVVAGLAELGRVEEAKVVLEELKLLNPNLAFVEGNLRRLYKDQAAIHHILDGLRAAGFA